MVWSFVRQVANSPIFDAYMDIYFNPSLENWGKRFCHLGKGFIWIFSFELIKCDFFFRGKYIFRIFSVFYSFGNGNATATIFHAAKKMRSDLKEFKDAESVNKLRLTASWWKKFRERYIFFKRMTAKSSQDPGHDAPSPPPVEIVGSEDSDYSEEEEKIANLRPFTEKRAELDKGTGICRITDLIPSKTIKLNEIQKYEIYLFRKNHPDWSWRDIAQKLSKQFKVWIWIVFEQIVHCIILEKCGFKKWFFRKFCIRNLRWSSLSTIVLKSPVRSAGCSQANCRNWRQTSRATNNRGLLPTKITNCTSLRRLIRKKLSRRWQKYFQTNFRPGSHSAHIKNWT